MVSVPGKLPGRRLPRKPIGKPRPREQPKKRVPLWNVQNKIILFTVFLFILAVTAWTLLWLYISKLQFKFLWGQGWVLPKSAGVVRLWVRPVEFPAFPDGHTALKNGVETLRGKPLEQWAISSSPPLPCPGGEGQKEEGWGMGRELGRMPRGSWLTHKCHAFVAFKKMNGALSCFISSFRLQPVTRQP